MQPTNRLTHAWVIWSLSALFMFYKFALEVSPSVMTATLMRDFDINGTQMGNFAACYFYAYLLLQIPAGLLIDRFGPRKVTSLAILICALGNLLFAVSGTYISASIGRFFIGVGAAFAVVSSFKLVANWFPYNRFALVSGLLVTVAMFGAVGGQAPLSSFINAVEWRPAMEILGTLGLILAALFFILVRDRAPHHEQRVFHQPSGSFLQGLKRVIAHRQSWWVSIYSGFAFAPVMVFGGLWGVSFISQAYGIDHILAAQSVSLIFIGFAIGGPIWGWFSDWLGSRKKPLFWGTLIALVSITLVIYLPHATQSLLMLLLLLFGFSMGSYLLSFTMMREINLPFLAATAIGFLNAFNALFGAFTDPLTGYFLDLGWDGTMLDGARIFSLHDYRIAFAALPLFLAISLLSLLCIKETNCKPTHPNPLP